MFPDDLKSAAHELLTALQAANIRVATAESCTGGLIVALLTDGPGASDVIDRGFVTYTNDAKIEMLGVRSELIAAHGAVSREVALAMAAGALLHSNAEIAVSCTGVAGPGGGRASKPVGLVHLAAARIGQPPLHHECNFGNISRSHIRLATVAAALALVRRAAELPVAG